MTSIREVIKRATPQFAREAYRDVRLYLATAPPEVALHSYAPQFEADDKLRLSLVLPSLSSEQLYGGVTTALDIFLQCGKHADAQMRIVLDDFDRPIEHRFLEESVTRAGVNPDSIDICPRSAEAQPIGVRANDLFFAFNWRAALNLRPLISLQQANFGGDRKPLIYLIQEYEPSFYFMSSTHMFARMAFDMSERVWGVFNSSQLYAYFRAQGHGFEREYVFEPWLSAELRSYLGEKQPEKVKRILVYGRPWAPRNCFPSLVMGLRTWTERNTRFTDWSVASAGEHHGPIKLGPRRSMRSLGKLSLDEYARCLQTTAVGISLMASPHPSYPPLEMAHFGIITLTNRYFCKDLRTAHDNIVSLSDILPVTIADALDVACDQFERSPRSGWERKSHMPHYLDEGNLQFLQSLAKDIAGTRAG